MSGRQEPSEQELIEKLRKRMYLLEHGPGSRNRKRYNRHGITHNDVTTSNHVLNGQKGGKVVPAADGIL